MWRDKIGRRWERGDNDARAQHQWCSRDRDLVKPSRPTPHRKIRDSRFKKYCHDHEVEIFSNFWHFSYLLWLFLICKHSKPKTHSFTKVLLSHIFAVPKASSECTCDRDRDKTSNLRDWDSKNGKSRDQDQTSRPGIGNLSPVAGQNQTLQGMAGRTNFPPTIPFPLLLLNLGNLWNFNQINSWFSVCNGSPKCFIEYICSTVRKEGRFIKYNTTRLAIYSNYNLVKGLRVGWFCLAGRIRPAGRRLPTPARDHHCLTCSGETNILCSKCNVHLCLNQWRSLETHFCEARSRRLQVSRLWILQRNRLVKFLKFNAFLFVVFAGEKQPKHVGKCQKLKKFNSEAMTTFKSKFGKMLKFWRLESRSQISSLGVFDEVSVSKF